MPNTETKLICGCGFFVRIDKDDTPLTKLKKTLITWIRDCQLHSVTVESLVRGLLSAKNSLEISQALMQTLRQIGEADNKQEVTATTILRATLIQCQELANRALSLPEFSVFVLQAMKEIKLYSSDEGRKQVEIDRNRCYLQIDGEPNYVSEQKFAAELGKIGIKDEKTIEHIMTQLQQNALGKVAQLLKADYNGYLMEATGDELPEPDLHDTRLTFKLMASASDKEAVQLQIIAEHNVRGVEEKDADKTGQIAVRVSLALNPAMLPAETKEVDLSGCVTAVQIIPSGMHKVNASVSQRVYEYLRSLVEPEQKAVKLVEDFSSQIQQAVGA